MQTYVIGIIGILISVIATVELARFFPFDELLEKKIDRIHRRARIIAGITGMVATAFAAQMEFGSTYLFWLLLLFLILLYLYFLVTTLI